ncbi:uncharacterized protein [Macrobrachium rosenbergii]|uniref:uncharacterized protein isoform X1 n=1 Tax=Macrobrachium rosenbergii TaxID=79674 RepID=UPI0034D4690E
MNDLNIYLYKLSIFCTKPRSGDKWEIHLARRGGNPTSERLFTLLLISEEHSVLVRDMTAFVNSFCHKLRSSEKNIHSICYNCLTLFTSPEIRQSHTLTCRAKTMVKYPAPGQFKYFKKVQAFHKTSHVAFLDLEAYNVNPDADEDQRIITKQKAYAYCYTIVDGRSGEYNRHRIGHGKKSINTMLQQLKKDWAEIRNNIPAYEIKMTERSRQKYQETSRCQICNLKFGGQVVKVRHHAHHIPEDNYVPALCRECNFKIVNRPKTLTVLVHNLSYNIRLILKESCPKIKFEIVKRDGGKYYSAWTGSIKFVDSGNMIRGSLASLSTAHIAQNGSLEITRSLLSCYPDEGKNLVLNSGKQYYPYDYIKGYEILNDSRIPPMHAFNSKLSGEEMTVEGYEHVKNVWKKFQCKNLLDYSLF